MEIQIKMETQGNRPFGAYPYALRIAQEKGLKVLSYSRGKRKKEIMVTLISGPHVHKKSRDQYQIISHVAVIKIKIKKSEQEGYTELKERLLQDEKR